MILLNRKRNIHLAYTKQKQLSFEAICRKINKSYNSHPGPFFWQEDIIFNDRKLITFMETALVMKALPLAIKATEAELLIVKDVIDLFKGRRDVQRLSMTEAELITAVFISILPDIRSRINTFQKNKKFKLL